jgi:hypothetical protein
MNKGANMQNQTTTWTMTCAEFMSAIDKMKDAEQVEKIAARQKSEMVPAYRGMSETSFLSMIAPARRADGSYRV